MEGVEADQQRDLEDDIVSKGHMKKEKLPMRIRKC